MKSENQTNRKPAGWRECGYTRQPALTRRQERYARRAAGIHLGLLPLCRNRSATITADYPGFGASDKFHVTHSIASQEMQLQSITPKPTT